MRGPTVEERAASPALAQNLVHLDWAVLAGQAALTQLALSQHQQRGGAGRLSRFVPWRVQLVSSEAGVWVYAPVTERGEALGVLELLLADPPDPQTLRYLRSAARALSYIVIADRRHSDLYECGQRTEELSLEAEIQRRLLPPSYSCQAEQFALAACLVPANQVGGDTFDDIVDRDTLHLSITDAMGRGGAAALFATLAVGLRNSRRRGAGPTWTSI